MKYADSNDGLGATAAYAAVIVVFVRTSTPVGSLKRGTVAAIVAEVIVGGILLTLWLHELLYPNWFRLWKPESLGRLSQREKEKLEIGVDGTVS
jgi:hypothetical protein